MTGRPDGAALLICRFRPIADPNWSLSHPKSIAKKMSPFPSSPPASRHAKLLASHTRRRKKSATRPPRVTSHEIARGESAHGNTRPSQRQCPGRRTRPGPLMTSPCLRRSLSSISGQDDLGWPPVREIALGSPTSPGPAFGDGGCLAKFPPFFSAPANLPQLLGINLTCETDISANARLGPH